MAYAIVMKLEINIMLLVREHQTVLIYGGVSHPVCLNITLLFLHTSILLVTGKL